MSITDFAARLDRLSMPWWVTRTMSWLLAFHALATAGDYLYSPPTADLSRSLTMVARIASIHTWGAWYLTFAIVLIAGLLVRRHTVVWLGHLGLSIMYAGFAVATLQATLNYAGTPLEETQGPIWRAVTSAFLLAGFHILLCWTRGPIPRRGAA